MKKLHFTPIFNQKTLYTLIFLIVSSFFVTQSFAQNQKTDFWKQLKWGGGLGLSFGNNYSEFSLSPSAVYPVNDNVSLGMGVMGSLTKSKNNYTTLVYGVSAISLFNPLPEMQLSLEVEQMKVNTTFQAIPNPIKTNYWNTGLFVGAGYRNGNVTLGARYNLLFDKDKSIYGSALTPFVRFYF